MFRIAVVCLLFVSLSTLAFAQQNNNLFPGDPGQTLVDNTNAAFDSTQRSTVQAIQKADQAAQQTVQTAKSTAQETANSVSQFLDPPQLNAGATNALSPTGMIDRWNQSTKKFFNKTKKSLSPTSFEPPKMSLPRPKGRVRRFFGEFISRPSTPGTAKRGFLPSILPKKQETPTKPQTIQDFLGLDRPE